MHSELRKIIANLETVDTNIYTPIKMFHKASIIHVKKLQILLESLPTEQSINDTNADDQALVEKKKAILDDFRNFVENQKDEFGKICFNDQKIVEGFRDIDLIYNYVRLLQKTCEANGWDDKTIYGQTATLMKIQEKIDSFTVLSKYIEDR